jgi:hypothetical protein
MCNVPGVPLASPSSFLAPTGPYRQECKMIPTSAIGWLRNGNKMTRREEKRREKKRKEEKRRERDNILF